MECGIGHQLEEDISPDGSMATFCPACPQPGINLPKDWKKRYTPYVIIYHLRISGSELLSRNQLIRTFIMDGNFSAEHMRHRSGDKDTFLSAGMAFMADPESYKAHLRSGQEIVQVWMYSLIILLANIIIAQHM
jgi:hypothetical protein